MTPTPIRDGLAPWDLNTKVATFRGLGTGATADTTVSVYASRSYGGTTGSPLDVLDDTPDLLFVGSGAAEGSFVTVRGKVEDVGDHHLRFSVDSSMLEMGLVYTRFRIRATLKWGDDGMGRIDPQSAELQIVPPDPGARAADGTPITWSAEDRMEVEARYHEAFSDFVSGPAWRMAPDATNALRSQSE